MTADDNHYPRPDVGSVVSFIVTLAAGIVVVGIAVYLATP